MIETIVMKGNVCVFCTPNRYCTNPKNTYGKIGPVHCFIRQPQCTCPGFVKHPSKLANPNRIPRKP